MIPTPDLNERKCSITVLTCTHRTRTTKVIIWPNNNLPNPKKQQKTKGIKVSKQPLPPKSLKTQSQSFRVMDKGKDPEPSICGPVLAMPMVSKLPERTMPDLCNSENEVGLWNCVCEISIAPARTNPPRAGSEVASAKVPLFAYAPTRPPHTALSVLKCPTTPSISTNFFVGIGVSVPMAHV